MRRRTGEVLRAGPLPALGALLALYLLVPIAVLLAHLAAGDGAAAPGLGAAVWISVLTASISTAVIAVLGVPLAWLLAHRRGRLWAAVGVAVQLPLALPPLMSGILLVEVVGPYTLLGRLFGGRLTDTTAAIVLAQTFVAAPFCVVAARSAFRTVETDALEAAATLGHGAWSRFRRVSLPIAAPGIRAGLLLAWLRAFGEFGATVILAYHPYSLPVFTFVQFSSTGLPAALPATGASIAAAVAVLVLGGLRPVRAVAQWARPLWAGRRPGTAELPAADILWPQPPADPGIAPVLAFDLRVRVGGFGLQVARSCTTPHLVILGASGGGKSMTLRALAGLVPGGEARVALGPWRLDGLRAEARRVGWVPQSGGLLPHLDVWRQVTFGVDANPGLAAAWLDRLGLLELRDRLPHELSGGQRQRVALARALARAPRLLLLDEPFAALDTPQRRELRRDLRRLQREIGIATVVVTHDPDEAAMLGEDVIVLADGGILQAGPRAEVFGAPASAAVARLLGVENVRAGRMLAPGRLASDGAELAVAPGAAPVGAAVQWGVRAADVVVSARAGELGAEVLDVVELAGGREVVVQVDGGGLELTSRSVDPGTALAPGGRCRVAVAPAAITVWATGAGTGTGARHGTAAAGVAPDA